MSELRPITVYKFKTTEDFHEENMKYPYSEIGSNWYAIKDILCEHPFDKDTVEAGDFPNNIKEHFWSYEGTNDEECWSSCGQLENGAYFFFTAHCCYTGFDVMGYMNLYLSNSWSNIVNYCMDEKIYKQYVKECTESKWCSSCKKQTTLIGEHCKECFWENEHEFHQNTRWQFEHVFSKLTHEYGKSRQESNKIANRLIMY